MASCCCGESIGSSFAVGANRVVIAQNYVEQGVASRSLVYFQLNELRVYLACSIFMHSASICFSFRTIAPCYPVL
ncbi:hypothetical protein WJX74_004351 [Apatococcus lobatus]|uniref:Uncharacterized protein n=1 Tax=Apatococcus lobatus TaxID=904363 RepID=A0AAW1RA55_9CHLO